MTKDEIIQAIAKRLARQTRTIGTWAEMVAGVQKMTPSERHLMLARLNVGKFEEVGKMLAIGMRGEMRADYLQQATDMLSDNQLSLSELEKIL